MFDNNALLYQKIAKDICIDIINSNYMPGEKAPSVREYAKIARINPNTVQKAYNFLDDLQIFNTKEGSGRFITDNQSRIEQLKQDLLQSELDNFFEVMEASGISKEDILDSIKKRKL
ncbi:MAG: GntR family transcriptional regulator [Mycoplasmatales bacterium]